MKRPLPPPIIISSTKDEPPLPRRVPGKRTPPIADELNRQRPSPIYATHRKRSTT